MRRRCRTSCWWKRAWWYLSDLSPSPKAFYKKKLNNHILEMNKDLTSCIIWCLLRHQITCHLPPCPAHQHSAATVARTLKKVQYVKTQVDSTHEDQLRHLLQRLQDKNQLQGAHLHMSRASCWGNSCCCWMVSVWGTKHKGDSCRIGTVRDAGTTFFLILSFLLGNGKFHSQTWFCFFGNVPASRSTILLRIGSKEYIFFLLLYC